MQPSYLEEIKALPIEEKLRLVEAIWDDIASSDEALPVPEWQKEELDRRKDRHSRGESSAVSWEEAKRRIRE